MSDFSIVGGRLRTLGTITRPSDTMILDDASRATANGIGLVGQGPYRAVSGVRVAVVVGPRGCTCCLARNGVWCAHRSLYAIATGQIEPPKRTPDKIMPIRPSRERQGWTRRPFHVVRPGKVTPFRPRTVA